MKTFMTGASSGFGAAIAEKLLQQNHELGLLVRNKDKFISEYPNLAKNAQIFIADVRDEAALSKAIGDFGPMDALINSAGLALGLGEFSKLSSQDCDEMIDTNIKGTLNACRAAIGLIRPNGIIINFGSVAGRYPYPGGHVYCASKSFIEQFSLALRCDFAASKIRVSVIAPGLAKTNFSLTRFKGDSQRAEALYEHTNYLSANDIAQVVSDIINLPPHVNINYIEIMPQTQSFNPLATAPKQF